jgi:predicted ATPase
MVFFAKACGIAGQQEKGLNTINECIKLGEKTGELWFQAEAWRTKGELLLIQANQTADEENKSEALFCFENAYGIAQAQGAKMWELWAAMSMAKFYAAKGQPEVGRKILQQTYDWFTEGFKTRELQQAQLLLESLSYLWVNDVQVPIHRKHYERMD